MDVNAFRNFYGYHFAENRKLWDQHISALTPAQFTQPFAYSRGSVQDQVLHLIEAEEVWFCELRNADFSGPYQPDGADDRGEIRAYWDGVETMMRAYLDSLQDADLATRPITFEEDKDLLVWQVLLHVANHGTDHRAQLLRTLHDLGRQTQSQDYIFYVYEHPGND